MTSPGAFSRPSDGEIRQVMLLLEPIRALAAPEFHGIDRIPDERPLLFVGNHTLLGVVDIPFLFAEIYQRKGIFLRSLGDHFHFRVPISRTFLRRFGVVDGTRENCDELMRQREAILVFPGGGREVAKRKGEKYQLVWKERLGFARMAIQHRCTIVPFAAVGVEDALDIVVDPDEILASPLGELLRRLGVPSELVMPLVRGIGPTPIPRPEKLYFSVGEPIETRAYDGDDSDEACREVRDRARAAVEAGIAELFARRENDPDRALLPRLLRPFRSVR